MRGGPSTPSGAAGGDLSGSYPNPTVAQSRGLRETAGPTTLSMGATPEGTLLARSGSTLVGIALGAGLSLSGNSIVGAGGAYPYSDPSRYHTSAWMPSGNGGITSVGGVAASTANTTSGITDTYQATRLSIGSGSASVSTPTSAYIARRGHNTRLAIRLVTSNDLTSQRIRVGWYNGTFTAAADAPGGSELWHLFRYSSVAGDTTWKIVNGTGTVLDTNYTVTDTGITVSANTAYLFEVTLSASGITYTITKDPGGTPTSFSTTISTNLPGASTGLGMMAHLHATTAGTRTADFLGGFARSAFP